MKSEGLCIFSFSETEDLNTSTFSCVLTINCLSTLGGVNMPILTLSFPPELKKRMDAHPEVNWQEVLRAGIERRARQLLKFQEMVRRGEL